MNGAIYIKPNDEANQRLLENVHPQDWENPTPAKRYNLVVIGAGTAGLVTAAGAAGLGAKVALVERSLMGGDCLNWGCVPSKCILRSTRLWHDLKEAPALGLPIPHDAMYDFAAVMERMRRIRSQISHEDSAERFRNLGVDVFLGNATFTGLDTVTVNKATLRFKKAVIATGAKAFVPPIEGIHACDFLTNETIFTLTEQPDHLTIVGGGPIGCELAQAFRRLGSQVTIVEQGPRLLPREDEEVSQYLQTLFKEEGIDLRLNTSLEKVYQEGKQKTLSLRENVSTIKIQTDQLLLAVGRAPNIDGLELENAEVKFDKKSGVHVKNTFQTSNPKIYAAGDICSAYKFTHAADAAARIVIRNALFPFLPKQKVTSLHIPWCTYTDPEVAHIGLNEQEAQQQGFEYDLYVQPFEHVHRALTDGEVNGFTKIVTQKGNDTILGATIVARHAGEMINEITLAMNNHLGLGNLANVIHPYPTQAESIKQAADAYNRTRLSPRLKKFLQWIIKKQI